MKSLILLLLLSTLAQAAVMSPDGDITDYLGPPAFNTRGVDARVAGHNLVIILDTPYIRPGDYNQADVVLRYPRFDLAIRLIDGKVRAVERWLDSSYFMGAGIPYGKGTDGGWLPVKASGRDIGQAEITYHKNQIAVEVPLDILPPGRVNISWNTALCGNSHVETWIDIPAPPDITWGGGPYGLVPGSMPCTPTSVAPRYGSVLGPPYMPPWGDGGYWDDDPIWVIPVPPGPPVPLPSGVWLFAAGLIMLWVRGEKNNV